MIATGILGLTTSMFEVSNTAHAYGFGQTCNVAMTASPSSVAPNGDVQVSWRNPCPTGNDWISTHPTSDGASNSGFLNWRSSQGPSGTLTFRAPSNSGTYEFRFFA